ncbi:MAG TPA: hypothetical protein DD666_08265 [Advenella kashmirensis]|uniref:Uncharacterized protein n=1 Tax=Advenella kashmirensis TaxID=310575 RepID=A0A356LFX3_9BURK|nr:hypothetical protein [Advenella kashmirensis]
MISFDAQPLQQEKVQYIDNHRVKVGLFAICIVTHCIPCKNPLTASRRYLYNLPARHMRSLRPNNDTGQIAVVSS